MLAVVGIEGHEMNERERLLTVLEGGRADQTPWYGDLSWWHAAHTEMGDLPEAYRDEASGQESYQSHFQLTPTTGEGYLKFHQDVGIGVMFYAPMVWRETVSYTHLTLPTTPYV